MRRSEKRAAAQFSNGLYSQPIIGFNFLVRPFSPLIIHFFKLSLLLFWWPLFLLDSQMVVTVMVALKHF